MTTTYNLDPNFVVDILTKNEYQPQHQLPHRKLDDNRTGAGRGVGMIFFMGGQILFLGASRHISDFFCRYTPKPEFQKKNRFTHRNLKKLPNSFLISNLFNEYFV